MVFSFVARDLGSTYVVVGTVGPWTQLIVCLDRNQSIYTPSLDVSAIAIQRSCSSMLIPRYRGSTITGVYVILFGLGRSSAHPTFCKPMSD